MEGNDLRFNKVFLAKVLLFRTTAVDNSIGATILRKRAWDLISCSDDELSSSSIFIDLINTYLELATYLIKAEYTKNYWLYNDVVSMSNIKMGKQIKLKLLKALMIQTDVHNENKLSIMIEEMIDSENNKAI